MRLIIPIIALLNCLLLGAHYLRIGEMGLTLSLVFMGLLSFSKHAWLRLVLAAILAGAAFIWSDTLSNLVEFRLMAGLPWHRTALIMGAVIAFNLLGLILVLSPWAGKRYSFERQGAGAKASAFIIACGLLLTASFTSPFTILLGERFFPGWGKLEILFLGLYAAWITGQMLDPAKTAIIRGRIWGLFSLIFFLQLGLGLLGVPHMLMTGDLHLPVPALIAAGPVYRGGGFFMLILFSASVLLVGPAWCSHLCYIGAWDHWLSKARQRTGELTPGAKYIRALLLALVLAVALGLRYSRVSTPIAVWAAALFGLVGVAIMLLWSRRRGTMVHCTAYCPIGILSNVLGKINPWRVRIGEGCTKCGKCSRACRYSALTRHDLDRGKVGLSCTLCGDCVNACTDGRMHYTFPGLSSATARAAFITLAVALHAVFLGVARI